MWHETLGKKTEKVSWGVYRCTACGEQLDKEVSDDTAFDFDEKAAGTTDLSNYDRSRSASCTSAGFSAAASAWACWISSRGILMA